MVAKKNFYVTCLVDETVQLNSGCRGENGLSILVEYGGARVLFDTGATGEVLSHNSKVLDKDVSSVGTVVISHTHKSHTGGLEWLLSMSRFPALVADPTFFDKRYFQEEGKELTPCSLPLVRDAVQSRCKIHLTEDNYTITEGITFLGRIPRIAPFEIPSKGYLVEHDGMLDKDEFNDEHALVLDTERGLVVLVGCCHCGLVNTLTQVIKTFRKPIHAIIGGAHMSHLSADRQTKTIDQVRNILRPYRLYLNHCTGLDPFLNFRNVLGNPVSNFPVGTTLEF